MTVFGSCTTAFLSPFTTPGKKGIDSSRGSTTRTVLFLGVLIESKGFFDLLRAVPLVLARTNDVRFVFVGDTSFPEAARAREWVHEHSLDPYVSFLGTKSGDEKTQVFLESDVFAFPTWYPLEGQPVAMIEAMAAGLPVVTTRHATIPDILGEDGALYVNKQDPADIAEKLLRLLGTNLSGKIMGQKNQNRFLEWHTVDKFASGVGECCARRWASSLMQSTAWKDYERPGPGSFLQVRTQSPAIRDWARSICCVPRTSPMNCGLSSAMSSITR